MKLKAKKPFYKDGSVILPGAQFETHEMHGRELVRKGIAVLEPSGVESDDPPKPKRSSKKGRK